MTENTRKIVRSLAICAFGEDVVGFDVEQLIECIKAMDRKQHFKLFEAVCALKHRFELWENLPCKALESKNAIRYKRGFSDFGVDVASSDLSKTLQAKCYQPGGKVKFEDIATFFTYSTVLDSKEKILAVTEGVGLVSAARLACEKNAIVIEEISNQEFAELVMSCFEIKRDDVSEFLSMNDIKLPQLRKYQEDAVEQLRGSLANDGNTVRLLMACGTGKTSTTITTIHREILKGSRTRWAWMVPSLHLLEQAREMFKVWAPKLSIGCIGGTYELKEAAEKYDCIICTYQSSKKIVDVPFDVIAVDEGHHLDPYLDVAVEIKEEKSELQGYLRTMASMTTKKFLLMSATMKEDADVGADYSYPLEEAIKDKNLCDYEICIPVLGEGDRKLALVKLIAETPAWSAILAYCNSREEAQQFVSLLRDVGVSAEYMDGKTPIDKRINIVKRFASGTIRVLSTIYVLGEGVDIPTADTCMFVENRSSAINVIQCVGRVLRLHDTKPLAHVVLPSTSENAQLVKFLKIMNSHDSRILRAIQSKKAGRVNLLLPESKQTEEDAEVFYTQNYDRFGKAVVTGSWPLTYAVLRQYIARENKLPPQSATFDDIKIGNWVNTQRRFYQEERLSRYQIEKLGEIAIWTWVIDPDEEWDRIYELVRQYIDEFEMLPAQSVRYGDENIGAWVSRQRTGKKGKDGKKMTDYRSDQLERLPGWIWEIDTEEAWEAKRQELIKHLYENKGEFPKTGTKLCGWVSIARGVWAGKRDGKLSSGQKAKLEEIPGWSWDPNNDKWSRNYALLKEWMAANDNKCPTQSIKYKGKNIGVWANTQRQANVGTNPKAGKMDNNRRDKLGAIPGWKW